MMGNQNTLVGFDLNRFKYEVASDLVPELKALNGAGTIEELRYSLTQAAPNYDDLKFEIAQELGIPFDRGYNGDKPARLMGAIGGKIGGHMVRRMIQFAEQELAKQQQS